MGKIKSTEIYAKWNGKDETGFVAVTEDGVTTRVFGLGLDRYDSLVKEEIKNRITTPLTDEEKKNFLKDVRSFEKLHENA